MQTLDWIVFFGYGVLIMLIVILSRRARTIEDFAVGSREIPGVIVFATLSSTFIGPGYSMGLANKVANAGYVWFFIFLFFSLQTILVAFFVAPRLRGFGNAYTLADVMSARYGRLCGVITGILSVALCAGFVGVIAKASGDIVNSITGIPVVTAIILSTIIVVVYSAIGGIKAVVLTDVIQFVILGIAIPLLLLFMLGAQENAPIAATAAGGIVAAKAMPMTKFMGLALAFLLGETLIPPYCTRALMARDCTQARNGFLLTGLFSILWFFVCASVGFLGGAMLGPSSNTFMDAIGRFLPVGLQGLAVAAMVSIVMSSQDSLLNAASVSFSHDVLSQLKPGAVDPDKTLMYSRWFTVIIGVAAVFFAVNVPGIVEALLYCYTLWAPTVVLPLIIGAMRDDVHPLSGLVAIFAGGIATAIWEWGLGSPNGIPSLLVGVVANQICFWGIQLFAGRSIPKWLMPIRGWLVPVQGG